MTCQSVPQWSVPGNLPARLEVPVWSRQLFIISNPDKSEAKDPSRADRGLAPERKRTSVARTASSTPGANKLLDTSKELLEGESGTDFQKISYREPSAGLFFGLWLEIPDDVASYHRRQSHSLLTKEFTPRV